MRLEIDEPPNAAPAPRLDFIPVELVAARSRQATPASSEATEPVVVDGAGPPPIAPILADIDDGWGERTSLFGELEA